MEQVWFSTFPDPRYLEMIFEEFFVSRGRGLSLERHFPWVTTPRADVIYAHMANSKDLLGGLVLKDCSTCMQVGPRVACIGLVFLRKEFRGKGLSRILLSEAIRYARETGFGALTLWTSKWRVYEAHGFTRQDKTLFGWVESPGSRSRIDPFSKDFVGTRATCLSAPEIPIPPFANSAIVLRRGGASCIVLSEASGPIVAVCKGDADTVASILKDNLPRRWRLNTCSDSPVPASLSRIGMSLSLNAANLQMWLSLDGVHSASQLAATGSFTVLDRI